MQLHLGPAEVPRSSQAMVLLAPRGVLVGFLIGRRERPKALMASLLWFSTFHRREDSAQVPSGIRQVWRTGTLAWAGGASAAVLLLDAGHQLLLRVVIGDG